MINVAVKKINDTIVAVMVTMIKGYQMILSPLLPNSCRFEPSCSHYSISALKKYGIFKGAALSLWRILRCNPFNKGGYDPV